MRGFELKTKQQVEDYVRGSCFYGVGGGGVPETGIAALNQCLDKGIPITVSAFDEIKDDEIFCSVFLMGSSGGTTEEMKKKRVKCGVGEPIYTNAEILSMALDELETYTGKKVDALFAIELGGANGACPLGVAMERGLRFYDGDADGRAVPEMPQALVAILDKPCLPVAIVNYYGDTNILTKCTNWAMIERNGKMLADSGFGLVSHACYMMTGKEIRDALVPGSLTDCLNVGTAIREARESGADPVAAAIKASNGFLLGKGAVLKKEDETIDGLYYGYSTVEGGGDFAGTEFKIWFENENHIVWKNGEKWVTSPDMIQLVDVDTCEPFTNAKLQAGDKVAIVAMPAREQFREGPAFNVLCPRYFGFDYDWVPVEELMK